jgi:hypothetical protein
MNRPDPSPQPSADGYDLLAALRNAARGIPQDGPEGLAHTELARRFDRPVAGLLVPLSFELGLRDAVEPLFRPAPRPALVRFADALRARTLVDSLGATFLSELAGPCSLALPPAGDAWADRGAAPAVPTAAGTRVALTPASVHVTLDVPLDLLQQRSATAADRLALDLAAALAAAIDRAALAGSGSGRQPMGLLNATGVPTVAFGANGAAPTATLLAQMEQAVGEPAGSGWSAGWVTSPAGRAKLRSTQSASYSGAGLWEYNLMLNRPAFASDALPANLAKGTATGLSPLLYGHWEELVVGLFSPAVELLVDARSRAAEGLARVVAVLDVAVAVRRPTAFVRAVDMVTTPAAS